MYDNYFVTIAIMERKCNRYINIYYDMNFDSSSNQEEVLKIMDEKAEYFLQNYPKVECKSNVIGRGCIRLAQKIVKFHTIFARF